MPMEIDLRLLQLLPDEPALSRRQLAVRPRISLYKTNYCLNALKQKGWVICGRFVTSSNKLQYLHALIPKGLQHKFTLTLHFLERKQAEFKYLKEDIAARQGESEAQNSFLKNRRAKNAGRAHNEHTIFIIDQPEVIAQ